MFTRAALAICIALAAAGCREQPVSAAPADPVFTGDRVIFPKSNLPVLAATSGHGRSIASLLNVSQTMDYGDYVWKDEGVPAAKSWVLVDLEAQTISVFRGKNEIGTAVALYGVDEKPTPLGRFVILEKSKDHWSNLYDAPMPYTLRLTMDGIAIHGSDVRQGAGTHGCVGVPLDFGSLLFKELKVGDEVLIVRDAGAQARTTGAGTIG